MYKSLLFLDFESELCEWTDDKVSYAILAGLFELENFVIFIYKHYDLDVFFEQGRYFRSLKGTFCLRNE
jgi:hypothetical protein